MDKLLEWFACCGKKKPKAPNLSFSLTRQPTIIDNNLRALAPRHKRRNTKKLSRVTWSDPVTNHNKEEEENEEALEEKIEAKVERRLHLTFQNGLKNKWARRILRDLNDPVMSQDELVNFELFIIGRLVNEGEDRYLVYGNWMKQWVAYLTRESDTITAVNNNRLLKKILRPKDVVFTVNQYIWNFLKLHHGVGLEFPISVREGDNGKKDPELWIQCDQDISLNTFLECPPWFIDKIKNPKLKIYRRREIERNFFDTHQNKESELKFMVTKSWYDKWLKYVFDSQNEVLFPENLDNSVLARELEQDDLRLDTEYILVNEHIWHLLATVYEGQPALGIKKINLRTRNNRVIEFESWAEEIEIRRERKNLSFGIINAANLSYDTRELLCLDNLKAQTLDYDESEIIFEADKNGGFGQAVKSLRSFV